MGRSIQILGGGPAGAAAAIAARSEGAQVRLVEKSAFPRHKVCGEFLSPEIAPLLGRLGVWNRMLDERPSVVRTMKLHFNRGEKRCRLPEPAFGLSRHAFDRVLWEGAIDAGAAPAAEIDANFQGPRIVACGRKSALPRGARLFGFKTHFSGPMDDAVELFFFAGCYVGVNSAGEGITNVCGIAPEHFLKRHGFDMDAVIRSSPALAARVEPLSRRMKWLTCGPLDFRQNLRDPVRGAPVYLAGDALSFVDPFTGTGLLSAVATGRLAGIAAARGVEGKRYLHECRRAVERPFLVSALLRNLLARGWGERLAPFVPSELFYALTRPRTAMVERW